MLYNLIRTRQDYALLVLRWTLAVVMLPHGAQKLLGWFGGLGLSGTLGYFSETLGIPVVFGLLAIIAEFFGSLALLIGFLGRLAAFGIACVMIVAAATSQLQHGFFMNWAGTQGGEGFEMNVMVLGASLAVMIGGSGAYSIDRWLTERRTEQALGRSEQLEGGSRLTA